MPRIIPIRDLKNTAEISEKCHSTNEPVFVTKNGYGDMVIMSIETFERLSYMNSVYYKIEQGERSIKDGKTVSGEKSLKELREKYEL